MPNFDQQLPGRAAPISAVVPTRNRMAVLARMLVLLGGQQILPAELIVIDASSDDSTRELLDSHADSLRKSGCKIVWQQAVQVGAAAQRNQGVALASQPVIAFFDDDIVFEEGCIERLWRALESDSRIGGVNAMIVNQRYQAPGLISRTIFRIMAGRAQDSYAGHLLGPAINLLPEQRPDLPDIVSVEWLNTTCTLYRREALPIPPFPSFFTGYSMMEDVTLSVFVGRQWRLANARTARIFHDSQSGDHKIDPAALSCMELVNRHYVMTRVLQRGRVRDYAKLALWEAFQLGVCAVQKRLGADFWLMLKGKCLGLAAIAGGSSRHAVS